MNFWHKKNCFFFIFRSRITSFSYVSFEVKHPVLIFVTLGFIFEECMILSMLALKPVSLEGRNGSCWWGSFIILFTGHSRQVASYALLLLLVLLLRVGCLLMLMLLLMLLLETLSRCWRLLDVNHESQCQGNVANEAKETKIWLRRSVNRLRTHLEGRGRVW